LSIITIALLLFICLSGCYASAAYISLRWPGRFDLARRLVSRANGLVNDNSADVVFQEGLFGCGPASLKMLARKLNATSLESAMDQNPNGLFLFSMLDLVRFVNQNGMSSQGYEFRDVDELDIFMHQESGSEVLLLIKDYETALSPASALMKPIHAILKLLGFGNHLGGGVCHWVLLHEIKEMRIVIKDPVLGKVHIARKRFGKLWDGHGMVVSHPKRTIE